MAGKMWEDMMRVLSEHQGKRSFPEPVSFPEGEVVARGSSISVGELVKGKFFNLDPNVFTVLKPPVGDLFIASDGFVPLEPGYYMRHYVEKRTRTSALPEVSERSLDGAKVSLSITLSYTIADPIQAIQSEHPVYTLFSLIRAYAQQYIKQHTHDEIMGSESIQQSEHDEIVKYIGLQYNGHHNPVKVFKLNEIVVERRGDPDLVSIRLEEKQKKAQIAISHNMQDLQQQLDRKDEEFKKVKAQYEAEIRQITADAENKVATQQLILDNERNQKVWQQERIRNALAAVQSAVVQVATPGYTPPPEFREILLQLVGTLQQEIGTTSRPIDTGAGPKPDREPDAKPENEQPKQADIENLDNLTQIMLNLLDRRKPTQ